MASGTTILFSKKNIMFILHTQVGEHVDVVVGILFIASTQYQIGNVNGTHESSYI